MLLLFKYYADAVHSILYLIQHTDEIHHSSWTQCFIKSIVQRQSAEKLLPLMLIFFQKLVYFLEFVTKFCLFILLELYALNNRIFFMIIIFLIKFFRKGLHENLREFLYLLSYFLCSYSHDKYLNLNNKKSRSLISCLILTIILVIFLLHILIWFIFCTYF